MRGRDKYIRVSRDGGCVIALVSRDPTSMRAGPAYMRLDLLELVLVLDTINLACLEHSSSARLL
jgi:hypothetical protein